MSCFFDDALIASRELELTLTGRSAVWMSVRRCAASRTTAAKTT